MVALRPRPRASRLDFTIGGTRDGKILAYRLDVLQDAGAYPVVGAFLPNLTTLMASGVYAIPRIEFEGRSRRDEHDADHGVPRRRPARGGAGDRAGDRAVRGRDRHRSGRGAAAGTSSPKDAVPAHRPRPVRTYDSGDYEGALDLALRAAGYDELRAEQQRRREQGDAKQLGIGVAVVRRDHERPIAETEFGEVEITPGRRRDSPHRLVLARPGSRDDVRA